MFERWNATLLRKGLPPWDPTAFYHLRGVPDEQIDVTVDVSPVALQVVRGLRQHRSQLHVIAQPGATDEQWARSIGAEHYVVARGGARTMLTDVLQDLPPREVADQGPSSDTVAGSSAPS